MAHGRVIRRAGRRAGRIDLRPAEGAFWLVLMLAIALGGARAGDGFPALIGLFLPAGIMEAQADVQGPSERITLPVHVPGATNFYAPQVLTPVPSRGLPDWLVTRARYAHLASATPAATAVPASAPAIAIVIDDLGPDVGGTLRAIALPGAVTLSFLPDGADTPSFAQAAARAGHEVMVHAPMEPEGAQDPGPMALRTDLGASENLRRFDWALSRVPGFAGINNHMGSRFTQDRAALIPVMERLEGHGAFFLDSRTAGASVVIPLARAFGVASAGRDVFLDDVEARGAVEDQLAQTERIARETGVAIAIGHPHDVTLNALKVWTASVAARGYRLVPASTAIRLRTEQDAMRIAAAVPARSGAR